MILNYYISKNNELGIYYILVNLVEKWVQYGINLISDSSKPKNRIGITFYDNYTEYIPMPEDFDTFDYLFTSMIEKDQIIIMAVPKKALIDKTIFKII